MEQFKVAEALSWDQRYAGKKSFTAQLYEMFLAIFILTFALIGAAMVAGVIFFFLDDLPESSSRIRSGAVRMKTSLSGWT